MKSGARHYRAAQREAEAVKKQNVKDNTTQITFNLIVIAITFLVGMLVGYFTGREK